MNPSEQASGGWLTHRAFGGLDWASQTHAIVIVDAQGKVVEDFEIEHSALGWKKFRERLQPYGSIPFAVETSQGAAVEQLLEAGMVVYPINPRSAQAYRERKAPSGVKDDRLDAWSFADACRVDGHGWKPLRPEDPLIKELRLLCRDEVTLIEQRTALINQLRQALAEYYPTALKAFDDWGAVSAWMFVQRFPTAQALKQAGKRQWEKFLHSRHLWRTESGPRRLELFAHATDFCGSTPTANAKSLLALSLVQMLFAIEKQLGLYRQRIEELFGRHPDHDLFGSLPGAGPKLAPRLLSEIGDDRDRFGGEPQGLQCLAGTAPVTRRTGKPHTDPPRWLCHQRWACDKHLRHAVYLLAERSLQQCAWAEIYYRHHRAKGRSHADALRRLGQRWRENHPQNVDGSKTLRREVAQPKPAQAWLVGAATQRPLTATNLQKYPLKTDRTSSLPLPLTRGYIGPGGFRRYECLLKRLAAVEGDVVTIDGAGVVVNGDRLPNTVPLAADPAGRPLPVCRLQDYRLKPGEALGISDYSRLSFDSRYFGPIPRAQIEGVVQPVWTW